MPALNFSARFADAVEAGTKRQTIRTVRKHPIKAGDTLYLYTGMRTKDCVKLGEAVCGRVTAIQIDWMPRLDAGVIRSESAGTQILIDEFAKADGFADARDMLAWFKETHGLPFDGVLIEW